MPIYEYQCEGCGKVFEVLQSLSDPKPEKHECGSDRIHRLMSTTAFVFKGSGWYVTDYARKDKGKSESSESGKSSSSPSSSSDSGTKSSGSQSAA